MKSTNPSWLASLTVLILLFGSLSGAMAGPKEVETKDLTIGSGPGAIQGSLVAICYESRLSSGAQVASNKGKSPFAFAVGSPDVILGLSDGVKGMRLGGVREIRIPANLAYGSAGQGAQVPPNSELQYVVRLRFLGQAGTESWSRRQAEEEEARKKLAELSTCVLDATDLEGVQDVGEE